MEQRLLQTISTRGRAIVDFVALAALLAFLVSAILALAVAIVPAAEPQPASSPATPATPAANAPPDSTPPAVAVPDPYAVTEDPRVVFELEIGNRMYPDWKETQSVRLQQEFAIGDTENSAKVVRFLPSFMIDEGKPHSLSARMDNPAVRIMVYFKGAPKDSAWAFLNFPPHFSPKSFYTFQLKSVQGYAGGEGAAAATAAPEAAAPGTKPTAGKPPTSGSKPPTSASKPK